MADPNTINFLKGIELPINGRLFDGPEFEFGIKGRGQYDYEWIFIAAIIFAFITAAGIGANDVANSFATSVGSKTLKMWQALLIAGLCEFFGAYLLGSRVTDTIRSKIVSVNLFVGHEDVLMFGMFCAVISTGFWLFLATFLELPVSTTHSITGSIIGFGLCFGGGEAINWSQVGTIVASWFLSPVLAMVICGTFFFTVRKFILRHENSYERAFVFFPILVFITVAINLIFVLYKGGIAKGQGFAAGTSLDDGEVMAIAFGVGAGVGIFILLVVNPRLKSYIASIKDEDLIALAAYKGNIQLSGEEIKKLQELNQKQIVDSDAVVNTDGSIAETSSVSTVRKVGKFEAFLDKIFNQEYVHKPTATDERIQAIHDNAEKFSLRTEFAFGYLQVFTAMFAAFAHGANDVANSIGPLAAIDSIYHNGVGSAVSKSAVPDWILVLGGAGIVFGLGTYGHIIISAMGVKMVRITPSRGFCIELATAFVIVVGSFLALPLSTTHTTIGSIIGAGIVEGNVRKSVNWKLLLRVFGGWLMTLIVAGCTTALLFSFGAFSPSLIYPLSKQNCMSFYATLYNATNGDTSIFVIEPRDGTVMGLVGYPSTGVVVSL